MSGGEAALGPGLRQSGGPAIAPGLTRRISRMSWQVQRGVGLRCRAANCRPPKTSTSFARRTVIRPLRCTADTGPRPQS